MSTYLIAFVIGFEAIVRFGNDWSTSVRPENCLRVPPMLNDAGPRSC